MPGYKLSRPVTFSRPIGALDVKILSQDRFLTRWVAFVGLALMLAFGPFTRADDEPAGRTDRTKPSTGRRFDREKLKRLRGRREANSSQLKRVTWKVGDETREALVYVPDGKYASPNPPLVFAFHGHGGRAGFSTVQMPFHDLWPEAVCVYPQGLPTAVPVIDVEGKRPGWQKFIGDQNDRDLAFFDEMLSSMKAEHHIDERRVFVAGHSNGGFFTYVLCAARGDRLAAVAPIAALIDQRDFSKQKAIPVLHVAGKEDPIVRFAPQERTMERIRTLNGCEPAGKAAGEFCTEYSSKDGPPVVTFIHPGGHEIPDGAPKRIVAFFLEHTRK